MTDKINKNNEKDITISGYGFPEFNMFLLMYLYTNCILDWRDGKTVERIGISSVLYENEPKVLEFGTEYITGKCWKYKDMLDAGEITHSEFDSYMEDFIHIGGENKDGKSNGLRFLLSLEEWNKLAQLYHNISTGFQNIHDLDVNFKIIALDMDMFKYSTVLLEEYWNEYAPQEYIDEGKRYMSEVLPEKYPLFIGNAKAHFYREANDSFKKKWVNPLSEYPVPLDDNDQWLEHYEQMISDPKTLKKLINKGILKKIDIPKEDRETIHKMFGDDEKE